MLRRTLPSAQHAAAARLKEVFVDAKEQFLRKYHQTMLRHLRTHSGKSGVPSSHSMVIGRSPR